MFRVSVLLSLLVVTIAPLQAQEIQGPPDFRDYIEYIRDLGMSEEAHVALITMADIRIGSAELFFVQDSLGFYGTGLRSLTCVNPEADSAAVYEMRREKEQNIGPEMRNLRWLADADSSGFVSTAEAGELRRLIEFGYKASYVASKEMNAKAALCRGFNLREDDVRELLDEYIQLQEKAKRGKIQPFPEVAIR